MNTPPPGPSIKRFQPPVPPAWPNGGGTVNKRLEYPAVAPLDWYLRMPNGGTTYLEPHADTGDNR